MRKFILSIGISFQILNTAQGAGLEKSPTDKGDRTFTEILLEKKVQGTSDNTLIDFPTYAGIGLIHWVFPKTYTWISLPKAVAALIAQDLGYTARKTCKEYVEGDLERGLCGAAIGAARNALAKSLLLGFGYATWNPYNFAIAMFLGALNNGLYDGLSSLLDEACSYEVLNDKTCTILITGIETLDSLGDVYLTQLVIGGDDDKVQAFLEGTGIGLIVYATIKTLDPYFSESYQDFLRKFYGYLLGMTANETSKSDSISSLGEEL